MSPFRSLRGARRELAPERVIRALEGTFELWSRGRSPWRERLGRELGLYSPEVLDVAVPEGVRHWTGDALRALRAREMDEPCLVPELTAVWLAGSIPTATFAAITLPLLAGSAVYAKPSAWDTASAMLFAESLSAVDPAVGQAVSVGLSESVLEEADALVAHGSDQTIQQLRARFPSSRVFVGYGHRLSVAAIGQEAEVPDAVAAVARDIALYDGRGCLSPAYVLVDDRPGGRAREFGAALAEELERLRTKLPRGHLTRAEETGLRELRARFSMGSGSRLWAPTDSTAWAVMLGPEGIRPSPGTLRNVPLVPVTGLEGLAAWCGGLAPHLSTLGQGGWGAEEGDLAGIALAAGASRVCPLGRMQLPPIDWRHDGVRPIRPLLRVLDVEVEEA